MKKGEDVILITGATGQQGGAVARELLSGGHRVRVMTRNPDGDKARALAEMGATVIQGDLDDAASLERAVDGAWGAFAIQNTWEAGVEGEEEQGKRFAEIAKNGGIEHFVYSSVASAQRQTGIPHFDNKWRVENKIRELGFPSYTIIRPVFFMENFSSPWFKPAIDDGKLTVSVQPGTELQMIAVADIGKYGALAFDKHEELNGREIDLAGASHTMPETAEILSQATGREVAFEPTPIEDVRQFSADFASMLEWLDRVGYDADISGVAEELDVQPQTFEAWATATNWD
ncbi:MAG: NmrA/HSCARG family protein [Thermoanaerobaculia bacterium]